MKSRLSRNTLKPVTDLDAGENNYVLYTCRYLRSWNVHSIIRSLMTLVLCYYLNYLIAFLTVDPDNVDHRVGPQVISSYLGPPSMASPFTFARKNTC